MNPSSNETQAMQPPSAPIEQGPLPANLSETGPKVIEQAPAGPETAAAPPAAMPAMPAIFLPTASPPTLPADDTQTTTTTSTTTNPLQVTDDGDLIEKEWVHKAKQIVESTRDDPFKQTEELTVFKADYMQKRYGKTIKLNQ